MKDIFIKKKQDLKPMTPIKPASEDVVYNEQSNEEEFEDEDIAEEDELDNPEKMNFIEQTPSQEAPVETSEDEILLILAGYTRILADAEEQITTKRIYWKSAQNINGIMTMNEVIEVAEQMKFKINKTGDYLANVFKIENDKINEKLKEFAGGLDTYEVWSLNKKK